ncbi:MAG: tyrosine-protein phosphatase [Pseudomonadota bacterium]
MRLNLLGLSSIFVALSTASHAEEHVSKEQASIERLTAETVKVSYAGEQPIKLWISDDTTLDKSDQRLEANFENGAAIIDLPSDKRAYVIIRSRSKDLIIVGERVLPLRQASNFRDIGGYTTTDGKSVKWGRVYRSGAMPLLTDDDYVYIDDLHIDSIVDFRSLEEREVTPNMVDNRTGALFLANDYSIAPLMKGFREGDGENNYARMERHLRPQYRAVFRRILADDGAVLYHCSAGQDRTGVATTLLYDVLGVDRETIVKDYHLSTTLRKTEWEMPDVSTKDYPGNMIVEIYAAARKAGEGPKPLYTPSGVSHIVQFLDYLDAEFDGAEGYLKTALDLSDDDIERLRLLMLE